MARLARRRIYMGLETHWAATENWPDDVFTPDGLPDGDLPRFRGKYLLPEDVEDTSEVYVEKGDKPCYCRYCVPEAASNTDTDGIDGKEQEEVLDCPVFSPEDDCSISLEYLPKRVSSGIISETRDSRKDIRQGGRKHGRGTYQNGKRGNSYYKLLRRGRVRRTIRLPHSL